MDSWRLRADPPTGLLRPVAIDPEGVSGPTKGQARGPRWRRTSTGLYVSTAADRNQVEQRILEESCRLPDVGAVTGWAALRLHGAGYFDGISDDGQVPLRVPLVVPPGIPLRQSPGIAVHRERLETSELTVRHGIPCASPARAAFDAARRAQDERQATAVLDMALAAHVLHLASFQEYLSTKAGWPGVRQARVAAQLADSRSKSPKETALRLIWCLDARLSAPRCNWPVADAAGRFIGEPDLLCEELAVIGEYDGAEHRRRSRHRADVRRDDLFRRAGLEPFRVVGADLDDVALVVDRINAAVARAQASRTPRTWRINATLAPSIDARCYRRALAILDRELSGGNRR